MVLALGYLANADGEKVLVLVLSGFCRTALKGRSRPVLISGDLGGVAKQITAILLEKPFVFS